MPEPTQVLAHKKLRACQLLVLPTAQRRIAHSRQHKSLSAVHVGQAEELTGGAVVRREAEVEAQDELEGGASLLHRNGVVLHVARTVLHPVLAEGHAELAFKRNHPRRHMAL